MKQILGYIIGCFLSALVVNWYDHVWFSSQISYWVYLCINFAALWCVLNMIKADETFKKLWNTVWGLIFVSTLVAQLLIWFSITNAGILSK